MQTEYLFTRLKQAGLDNIPTLTLKQGPFSTETMQVPMFAATEKGFEILYFTPEGYPARYQTKEPDKKRTGTDGEVKAITEGRKASNHLKRTRYAPGFDTKHKYDQPFASGLHPYYPLPIINKYKNGTSIERLVLIEGELKATALCSRGIDAVGLMGITGIGDSETKDPETGKTTELHYTLADLLTKCHVKHLFFITDADTFYTQYHPEKDLYNRPAQFYSAVQRFSAFAQNYLAENGLQTLIFKALHRKYATTAKGADDFLNQYPEQAPAMLNEITKLTGQQTHFEAYTVTHLSTRQSAHKKAQKAIREELKEAFGLDGAWSFYQQYNQTIGTHPFTYRGAIYQADALGYVQLQDHPLKKRFMRVTDKWFTLIPKINKFGDVEEELRPYGISEIERDTKHLPGFIDTLPRYISFANEPDFTTTYNRNWRGFYNLANPLPYTPAPGNFTNIANFLRHIAGEGETQEKNHLPNQTGNILTVLVDWLNIAIKYPKQKLPVIILVSPENNTGKSTFLKLVSLLLGSNNSVVLNKEQFTNNFNSHFITKLFIGVDEGFIEREKKAEKEAFKQLITSDTQFINFKGVDRVRMDFHGKLAICSNDDKRVMQMDDNEDRWFVIRVTPYRKENPDLETLIRQEMPAFVHWLLEREPHHPRTRRFWFETNLYLTAHMKNIVKNTRARVEINLADYIEECFLTHRPDDEILLFDVKHLVEALNQISQYKVDAVSIKEYLSEKRKLEKEQVGYHTMYVGMAEKTPNGAEGNIIKRSCRPYIFKAKDWVTPQDYQTYFANRTRPRQISMAEVENEDMPDFNQTPY